MFRFAKKEMEVFFRVGSLSHGLFVQLGCGVTLSAFTLNRFLRREV